MRVPANYAKNPAKARLVAVVAAIVLLVPPANGAEHQVSPWTRVSLEKLGFPGVSQGFLAAGASALTVNFLDDDHLLVTFGMRGLVRRPTGDPGTDEDRDVAAEIVELPSGKIEARTQWHLHDHGRYLWPLGHGRFMLRIGGSLSTIAPLANLHKEPFQRVAFPARGVTVDSVMTSPEGGVLTVESEIPLQRSSVATWADAQAEQSVTLIDLYRLSGDGSPESPLTITSPHSVRSTRPIMFPIDEDGFLWATNDARDPNDWTISFHAFAPGDKKNPAVVGEIQSSCQPRMMIASRSEYVAVTCMGTDSHMKLATYGFDGHENWEESMDMDSSVAFAFAPSAGRFALSRIAASASPVTDINGIPGDPTFRQEVRIYQTESGDLVLKASNTPVMKTAENFDLSSDGKMAALVRDGEIVVYKLPAPSERDRKAAEEIAKFAPPPGGESDISLQGVTVREQPGETVAGDAPRAATPVVAGASTPAASIPAVNNPAAADNAAQATRPVTTASASPSAPVRKRPTLLLPGEQAEFKDRSQQQHPQ